MLHFHVERIPLVKAKIDIVRGFVFYKEIIRAILSFANITLMSIRLYNSVLCFDFFVESGWFERPRVLPHIFV